MIMNIVSGVMMFISAVVLVGLATNCRSLSDVYWTIGGNWKKKFDIPYIPKAELASYNKGDEILSWLNFRANTEIQGKVYFNKKEFAFFPDAGGMFRHRIVWSSKSEDMLNEFEELLASFKQFK